MYTSLNLTNVLHIFGQHMDAVCTQQEHKKASFFGGAKVKGSTEIQPTNHMRSVTITHSIHAWYIYQHLPLKNQPSVGKYTSPMDGILSLDVIRWIKCNLFKQKTLHIIVFPKPCPKESTNGSFVQWFLIAKKRPIWSWPATWLPPKCTKVAPWNLLLSW